MSKLQPETKPVFLSSICHCALRFDDGRIKARFCGYDHIVWAITVGLDVWEKKQRDVNKSINRGYGEEFAVMLERWLRFIDGSEFFRSTEIPSTESDVSAELAMYVFETHGILIECCDGKRLTDYLQGKSILGLMEKMWQQDMHTGAFWAEELVADGKIGFRQAEQMFARRLNGELLWLYARYSEPDFRTWE